MAISVHVITGTSTLADSGGVIISGLTLSCDAGGIAIAGGLSWTTDVGPYWNADPQLDGNGVPRGYSFQAVSYAGGQGQDIGWAMTCLHETA